MFHPLLKYFNRRPQNADPLDDVLFKWPTGDPFTVRDLLRSAQVKGITGSGKTSGSGNFLLDRIVAHPRSTAMIVGQKPEDLDNARDIFARHGKLDKLIVIEEGGIHKCNFFDDEMKSGADARGMTEFITILGEGLQAGQGGGRENERFWRMLEQRIIYNAVEAVRQGRGGVTAPELMRFITTAPASAQMLKDEKLRAEWEKEFHFETMEAAFSRQKSPVEAHDCEVFRQFWGREWPELDEKPKTSGQCGVLGTLHAANTGLCRETTSTNSNVSPRMVDNGYSFFINYPFYTYGATGRYIATGWKYKLQKHILRRRWNPEGYFTVLWCDEYQESMTSFDPNFLVQCRSHGGGLVALTQTIHSEYSQMGGDAGQHKANMLLGNFGLHIFHLSDPTSAQFASNLLGQYERSKISFSPPETRTPKADIFEDAGAKCNISTEWQPILQPNVLMSGLRTGGAANGYLVDGVVIRLGMPFSNGLNCQFVSWSQKDHTMR
jgi:hypothetical protein